jgi:hypothetical protein
MDTHTIDLEILALALPLTVGLVQILKQALLPGRWAGVASVAVGTLAGLAIRATGIGDGAYSLAALTGLIAGLSAAGVWSGTKAVWAP